MCFCIATLGHGHGVMNNHQYFKRDSSHISNFVIYLQVMKVLIMSMLIMHREDIGQWPSYSL
jgi:hypothetical protein